MSDNLTQRINWAITKPDSVIKTHDKTISSQKKDLERLEREWGNNDKPNK